MSFKVVVNNGYLNFSAAHFITFGGKCERLHGHNYALSLEIEGPLGKDSYVFDFVALKKIGRAVVDELDHRFLLAEKNPHIQAQKNGSEWEIRYQAVRYVMPDRDVRPLPVDNITAERLAEYLWGEVARQITAAGAGTDLVLCVGVEEAPGQTAYYRESLSALS